MNRVFLLGNLGGDPEFLTGDNRRSVGSSENDILEAEFSMATNEFEYEEGEAGDGDKERVRVTTWHDVVVVVDGYKSRRLAESLESRRKGDRVLVEGRLMRREGTGEVVVRAVGVTFLS